MRIFDKGSVELILRHGIEKGYWTLEQLDFPTASYERMISEARSSTYFGKDFYPATPYVNPLRKTSTVEVVAAEPEHDDLASAASPSEGQRDVDVPPAGRSAEGDPPVPGEHHRPDLSGDQDPTSDGGDHGHQTHLAATGRLGAPGPGGDGPSAVEPQSTRWPAGAAPF